MPAPKKNQKGKRKSSSESENLAPIDVQYNPDIVTGHLQELEVMVEAKCLQILKDVEFMKTSLQQAFHLELIKIPTQVKQMSLARFREEFGESLEAVTRGAIGGVSGTKSYQNYLNETSGKGNKTNINVKAFQTPSHSKLGNNIDAPATQARHPREGETILSQNGSPLGVFNTIVKAPRNVPGLVPATPGVFVPLDSGEIVELEAVESLPDDLKQDAVLKVQEMMNNMQQIMAKLMNSSQSS